MLSLSHFCALQESFLRKIPQNFSPLILLAYGEFWCTNILGFHIFTFYQSFTFALSRSCLRNTSLPQDRIFWSGMVAHSYNPRTLGA